MFPNRNKLLSFPILQFQVLALSLVTNLRLAFALTLSDATDLFSLSLQFVETGESKLQLAAFDQFSIKNRLLDKL